MIMGPVSAGAGQWAWLVGQWVWRRERWGGACHAESGSGRVQLRWASWVVPGCLEKEAHLPEHQLPVHVHGQVPKV